MGNRTFPGTHLPRIEDHSGRDLSRLLPKKMDEETEEKITEWAERILLDKIVEVVREKNYEFTSANNPKIRAHKEGDKVLITAFRKKLWQT